jgi:hypothetical protein
MAGFSAELPEVCLKALPQRPSFVQTYGVRDRVIPHWSAGSAATGLGDGCFGTASQIERCGSGQ